MTFPSFQFPLYRFADELCPPFLVLKDGIDAVKRSFWEARRGLLVVDLFPAHHRNIDDITNCYKGRFRRYLLLLSRRLLISSKTSKRETEMTNIRSTTVYPVKISLDARDQYNDYSVAYDYRLTVDYGNGRSQTFDVGSNKNAAISKYDAAVALACSHTAKQAA